ncbi:MAG: hypothetical protein COA83_00015 [Methylophaga sp.]|nr:MAG: hypothetical protein COA83_00015 [Methylophaga sp.]
MKKTLLTVLLFTLSAPILTTQAATTALSFAEQLNMQKTQLRPQEFNFFSDRYKQVKAQQDDSASASLKAQLDSQKDLLRPQFFSFKADVYNQTTSH